MRARPERLAGHLVSLEHKGSRLSAAVPPLERSEARRSETTIPLGSVVVVCPSLHGNYSGVTSTIIRLVPEHARRLPIATIGPNLPASLPKIRWRDLIVSGWGRPPGHRFRVWHARRSIEMVAGLLLARLLRQPWKLVFTSAAQRRHTRFTKALIRRMDAVIATSPESASFLEVPSTVILHGVDTECFRPARDRAAAWAAMGLPGRFGIGIFGRIRPQKGTDLFVQAMVDALPDHPEWTAVVVGLARPAEQRFVEDLKARIAAAGLTDRIRFLGERPVDEIPRWFRALSLVVAPPRWEGFGLIPLEAMASATPVIASRAGAHSHLVEPGRTGWLVPADDAKALTGAVAAAMALTPAEREDMGAAGRARAEARFSIEVEARGIEAVYKTVYASS